MSTTNLSHVRNVDEQGTYPRRFRSVLSDMPGRVSSAAGFATHFCPTVPHTSDVTTPGTDFNSQRDSPEDQKILEDEYQRNPKPDKAARMEIVRRVALGEKEVQVRRDSFHSRRTCH